MVSWSHGVCGEAPKAVVEGTAHLRAAREEGEGVREKEEGEGGGGGGKQWRRGRRGRDEQGRATKEYKGRELGSNPFPCVDIMTSLPGTRSLFLEGPSPFGLEIQVSY